MRTQYLTQRHLVDRKGNSTVSTKYVYLRRRMNSTDYDFFNDVRVFNTHDKRLDFLEFYILKYFIWDM